MARAAEAPANPDPLMVLIVRLLDPASVADDGPSPAKRTRPGKQLKRDLVFSLRQCDKENHGWCEGQAADRRCQVSI
jgi:hypothetical protein